MGMKISLVIVLTLLGSCSFKKKELANQTQEGHEELYSEPEDVLKKIPKGKKRLLVVATNDIGGSLGPQSVKVKDSHHKDSQRIEIGGVDAFASYLQILKKKAGALLLVDSGDLLPPNPEDYSAVQEFYETLGYDALAPGLSDFGMRSPKGQNPVRSFAQDSKVPVLTSNLYEMKSARAVEWKGTAPYALKEISGIKVGIIGILPDDIPKLTPLDHRVGLFVEKSIQSTLHQARRLRSLGAQAIVVLTHQALDCGLDLAEESKLPLKKVNFDPRKDGVCDTNGLLGSYLARLPAKLVDVVVAGRSHQKVANFINGIVVVSGFDSLKSFSTIELFFDETTGKLLSEDTVIHQPVMVCREFFKETTDCFPEDPSVDHKSRIPAKFLGETVTPDEGLRLKFKKFFEDPALGIYWDNDRLYENFQADLIYRPVTEGHTHLVKLELSGAELRDWLERSFNLEGADSWFPNPFSVKDGLLTFSIGSEDVLTDKTYAVLTDLETLQGKITLRHFISSSAIRTLTEVAWSGALSSDAVSTKAAATVVPDTHRQ